MYAKKKKYDNGGKITGTRTREAYNRAAQDEYIRRANANRAYLAERYPNKADKNRPLSEAEEAQTRAMLSDMRNLKAHMGEDYRPIGVGSRPHKNYDALKESGKFTSTGTISPSLMVEEILMSLPKKDLQYGKGGTVKYRSGGFPDLTGDGKVTMADILKGRGVKEYAKGGMVSSPKVEKLKLLKQQLSAAKTSRYATEEDRQKDIAMIERQIRDLGV